MKFSIKIVLGVLPIFAAFATFADNTNVVSIIPLPQKMERHEGVFQLQPGPRSSGTKILVDAASRETGQYLAGRLRQSTGYPLPVLRMKTGAPTKGTILLTTQDAKSALGPEGYELTVTPDSVVIRAPETAGLFYGVQSLLQLLPPDVFAQRPVEGIDWEIPCVTIEDQPRFKWRGLMLDVARHFFNRSEVEQILDAMALHKMNTFHWHLVDDQGWRIEIKKYPLLTQVGAWRKEIGFKLDPKASTAYGPDGRYGGYYTQADIREVVAYARARHITIVPEIEMPGHSTAALKAYPQYSCTGGPFNTDLPGGIFDGVYCAGNELTFAFLDGMLTEVMALFPGKYIHVGGDEVTMTNWDNCSKCQARMREEHLDNGKELEGYFMRRVERIINAHGHTLIGWSEITEGGLAKNAAVMDWIGGARMAAHTGHDVVMTPLKDCYLDHYQSKDQEHEPHAIGGYLPLTQIYEFEPMPANIEPGDEGHILGAQGNCWTEYMPSLKHVEYMIFPRLCALSEVVWSPKDSRNWDDFTRRLPADLHRLDELGVNYRHGLGDVREDTVAK
jgi:hexosaminidase